MRPSMEIRGTPSCTLPHVDDKDRLAQYDGEDEDLALDGRHWITYAIGAVVMSASNMDVSLGTLYASLLRSEFADTVAYGQSFDITRQACLAAIDALPDHPVYARIRSALARAKDLYEDRNQVAHGLWTGESGPVNNPRMLVRYRRYGKKTDAAWTQKGLMLLAGSCLEVSDELNELAASIRELR
jgi:hypothetical protein